MQSPNEALIGLVNTSRFSVFELGGTNKSNAKTPSLAAACMEFDFLRADGDEKLASVDDYMMDHSLPDTGCELRVYLESKREKKTLEQKKHMLEAKIVISDYAKWDIQGLGVGQESQAHGGFRGTLSDLLDKVIDNIEMMRSAYTKVDQVKFDFFISKVNNFLSLSEKSSGGTENYHEEGCAKSDIVLVVRDPSGLSTTELLFNDAVNKQYHQFIYVTSFPRSIQEEMDLGIGDENVKNISSYIKVNPERQLTTACQIAELIKKSKSIVALTGAGISVESGITPFRAPGNTVEGSSSGTKSTGKPSSFTIDQSAASIWGTFDAARMTVANFNNPTCTEDCKNWWLMKHSMLPEMHAAKPNPAHEVFALLHERKQLNAIVTQNIDSLHVTAGVPEEKVLEIHGHMRGLICSDHITTYNPLPYKKGTCHFKLSDEEARKLNYFQGVDIPSCPFCQCPLRTETVMFEQPMPVNTLEAASLSMAQADLVIIIGSTLIVKPASELPLEALRRKQPLIVINPYDITLYDEYATGLVREPAGKFMKEVMTYL